MSYKFEGWLGHGPDSADGNMQWGAFEPKKWEEDDVDMQITHCGICATDIHTLRSDWGPATYRESRSSIHIKPCTADHRQLAASVTNSWARPSA